MFNSVRSKLIVSLLATCLLAGSVSLFVGGRLLYRAVLNEANSRIRLDLNAAREIYRSPIEEVAVALNVTALGTGFRSALARRQAPELADRLRRMAQHVDLDFAGMALGAAIPVFDHGTLLGVLYGGILLNRRPEIVDTVRETVFRHETYEGQSAGTATADSLPDHLLLATCSDRSGQHR